MLVLLFFAGVDGTVDALVEASLEVEESCRG